MTDFQFDLLLVLIGSHEFYDVAYKWLDYFKWTLSHHYMCGHLLVQSVFVDGWKLVHVIARFQLNIFTQINMYVVVLFFSVARNFFMRAKHASHVVIIILYMIRWLISIETIIQ